jgi:opacity protein-like surface antigen
MKKAFLVLAAVALCTNIMNAQDGKSVRFGLKVAPNFGWIKPDDKLLKSDGTLLGFNFGLMGDFMLGANQNYAFSTGLMYMTKLGGKYILVSGADSLLSTTKSTVKLQYIQLPLTIKLKTNEIGYMTYYGQIGVETALRVSAKGDVQTTFRGTTASEDNVDLTDATSIFRAALLVGGGVEYNFSGNTSAMLGVTYSNGFTNAFDGDVSKAKLHYFELSAGVFF